MAINKRAPIGANLKKKDVLKVIFKGSGSVGAAKHVITKTTFHNLANVPNKGRRDY